MTNPMNNVFLKATEKTFKCSQNSILPILDPFPAVLSSEL